MDTKTKAVIDAIDSLFADKVSEEETADRLLDLRNHVEKLLSSLAL